MAVASEEAGTVVDLEEADLEAEAAAEGEEIIRSAQLQSSSLSETLCSKTVV